MPVIITLGSLKWEDQLFKVILRSLPTLVKPGLGSIWVEKVPRNPAPGKPKQAGECSREAERSEAGFPAAPSAVQISPLRKPQRGRHQALGMQLGPSAPLASYKKNPKPTTREPEGKASSFWVLTPGHCLTKLNHRLSTKMSHLI